MLVFLRSAGKLFQACGTAYEIRLFRYVVVLIFGTIKLKCYLLMTRDCESQSKSQT